MQLLLIHADFMEYEAKERTKVAEDIEDERRRGRVEEVLAVLVAVESGDDAAVVEQAAREILDVARTVHAERILLYPYAHLSPNLAPPNVSIELLKALEERLRGDFEVHRAPFGWYKAFTLRCKGHPLSELSRRITGRHESAALKAEERGESRFYIMDCDGTLHEPKDFDFSALENLRKFYEYEAARSRVVDRMPPHVELMRRLEIADYEPSSDSGNLRFYPKGALIKELIKSYVSQALEEYGAMRVETPLMYSMDHPTLRSYLDRFPARQYSVGKLPEESFSLFLRFAACFGQFMMGKDMEISYKHLPLRMFEIASSFRLEKRGELVGLRRLRNFTMPDMHTLCRDMEQAVEEFRSQFRLCMDVLQGIGFDTSDYEVAIRFTKDFYDAHRDLIE
ncbi:MAG TPA: threonine--tRNA ligase, partial [Methanomicrobia archaeon]|nr:threonine--tRNA ligase [Methanomicrobia archaeon]HEX59361.1 threonine--tRNA ligase [Methanomicrobia archaeon]